MESFLVRSLVIVKGVHGRIMLQYPEEEEEKKTGTKLN
jgi:hypothetical protein